MPYAILNIYVAYDIAEKAFGNVLMSNFYFTFRGGAPNSDRDLGGVHQILTRL